MTTNFEKAQKLAMQFESVHNFNLGLSIPIENQVTQEFKNIHNQEIFLEIIQLKFLTATTNEM